MSLVETLHCAGWDERSPPQCIRVSPLEVPLLRLLSNAPYFFHFHGEEEAFISAVWPCKGLYQGRH